MNAVVVSKAHEVRPNQTGCNGGATVNVSGGAAPYSFEWKNGNNQIVFNGDTLKDVCSGNYFVTVKDKNGITSRISVQDERYISGELIHHHKK